MSKLPLFIFGFLIGLVVLYFVKPPAGEPLQNGDIIFHNSTSSQSPFLKELTGSIYTHMGVVFFQAGKPMVYEAVGPVKYTTLDDWIDRGTNSHYVIKRLKDAKKFLTEAKVEEMMAYGKSLKGKPYDDKFQWNDNAMYCSELVWKIFKTVGIEIGSMKKFNEFDLSSPTVEYEIEKRYGEVPFVDTEFVITPVDMFNSPKLKEINRVGDAPN